MSSNNKSFVKITNREVWTKLESIEKQLENVDIHLKNHLEHHKTVERKNIWFLSIVMGLVTLFVNLLFLLLKGG